jgi:hypothetical protein
MMKESQCGPLARPNAQGKTANALNQSAKFTPMLGRCRWASGDMGARARLHSCSRCTHTNAGQPICILRLRWPV